MIWVGRFFLYVIPSLALLFPWAQFLPLKVLKVVCVLLWLGYAVWLERVNGVGIASRSRINHLIPLALGVIAVGGIFWFTEYMAQQEPVSGLFSRLSFSLAFILPFLVVAPGKSLSEVHLKFWKQKSKLA